MSFKPQDPFIFGKQNGVAKSKKKETGSFMQLIKDKTHIRNLLLLLVLWAVSAFDYNLINFQLKYIDGSIYTNTIVSAVSEVSAYLISGVLYNKLGTRLSFIIYFLIAIVGSILLISLSSTYVYLVPVFVLGSKFGISASFNCVYLANSLFPPLYASTTLGIFNFFARMAAMLSPPVAEIPAPTPMIIYSSICMGAAIVSFFIKDKVEEKGKFNPTLSNSNVS